MTLPLAQGPGWPYRLAMAVVVSGTLTLGAILGYVAWPQQFIYVDTPLRVVSAREVKAGAWLTLQMRYSKPYQHESLVGVMFASQGHVAFGPVGLSALPPGEHDFKIYVQVPVALPPGEYVVILIVERQVRLPLPALFDRAVTASSEPFWVR